MSTTQSDVEVRLAKGTQSNPPAVLCTGQQPVCTDWMSKQAYRICCWVPGLTLINLRCLSHRTPHSSLLLVQNSHSTCTVQCGSAEQARSGRRGGDEHHGTTANYTHPYAAPSSSAATLPAANRKAPAHAYVLLSALATNRTMWTRLLFTLLALGIRSVQLSATDTGPLRSSSFRDSPSAWLSRPAGMVIWASSLECRQRAGSTALVKQARRRKAAHCLPRNTLSLHAWPLARPPETQDDPG